MRGNAEPGTKSMGQWYGPPMSFADRITPLSRLLPNRLDGHRNVLRLVWNAISGLPGGKRLFSRLVGQMAPYSGSIRATVLVLRPGYAEVQMHDRRAVRNHLDCVHAIALANLAELAGNVALAYSLPDDARFIVSGMKIEYLKKARGTITAIGEPPVPRNATRAQYDVPVTLRDEGGDDVAKVVLQSLVGPKPGVTSDRRDVN
jgi:acyl-coenzyme A thioesterase PaaI-like protein